MTHEILERYRGGQPGQYGHDQANCLPRDMLPDADQVLIEKNGDVFTIMLDTYSLPSRDHRTGPMPVPSVRERVWNVPPVHIDGSAASPRALNQEALHGFLANGLLIGCHALHRQRVLVTQALREFELLEGLRLANWSEPGWIPTSICASPPMPSRTLAHSYPACGIWLVW